MRPTLSIIGVLAIVLTLCSIMQPPIAAQDKPSQEPANPSIDMAGHLRVSAEAARHRESRRVSEEQFLKMSHEAGTIILDARSKLLFDDLHIAGAINLSFPDIAVATLAKTIPDKNTRILIYCNNNFVNSEKAFPSKIATASLNLSTYIALYDYGYRNVYELAPQLDPAKSILKFESTTNKLN
jgi:hypothetical protein